MWYKLNTIFILLHVFFALSNVFAMFHTGPIAVLCEEEANSSLMQLEQLCYTEIPMASIIEDIIRNLNPIYIVVYDQLPIQKIKQRRRETICRLKNAKRGRKKISEMQKTC